MAAKTCSHSSIYRVIDANANRLKEGLRVCEEVSRFILEDNRLSRDLKSIRHQADGFINALACRSVRLHARDSVNDTGRVIHSSHELKRSSVTDLFNANIQRVKESMRVLEEFSKIGNKKCALGFKDLRYRAYEIEKQVGALLPGLLNRGQSESD